MGTITRDTFCKAMNMMNQVCDNADMMYDKFNMEGVGSEFVEPLVRYMVDTMAEAFNDTRERAIDFFVYECDFGRDYDAENDFVVDGNVIDISTPAKLYDYLVS